MKPGNQTVSRNFAVLSAGQLGSRFLAFAITIHIAQVLLPELFGAVVFASGALLYAGLLVDFGFEAFGPIEVSRGTSPPAKLVGNVLTFRSLLTVPAFCLLALFSSFLPMPAMSKWMIDLYGISLVANALDLGWFFLGGRNMWPAVIGEIITQSTLALGAYGFIHGTADALLMPLFFLAGRLLCVSFLLTVFVREHGAPQLGIDLPYFKSLLRSAIPLCGSQIMAMISNNFDLMLIGVCLGTAGAGLYGAAMRVVWVPTAIAVAYYTALRPLVAHSFVQGFHTVEAMFKRSVRVTTALSFGIGAGGLILAPQLMSQVFGAKYSSATGSFIVLLLAFCLMLVSRNYRLILVTFNHQVTDLRIMSAAAVVNIGLNLLLIKPFGITGAACATLASESLILVLDYLCTRRLIDHVPLGRYIPKPLICCLVMSVILQATSGIASVYPRVAIGALAYAILLVVTRVITLHEIRSLVRTWLPQQRQRIDPPHLGQPPQPAPEIAISESASRTLSTAATGNEQ